MIPFSLNYKFHFENNNIWIDKDNNFAFFLCCGMINFKSDLKKKRRKKKHQQQQLILTRKNKKSAVNTAYLV